MDPFLQDEPLEYAERYFFTPDATERSNAVWTLRLGRNVAKRDYYSGPRTTTYYSLHFVLEGAGTFVHDGRSYSLGRDDLFCLFPNRTSEYYTSEEQPLQLAWIAFDGRKAAHILEQFGIRPESPYRAGCVRPELRKRMDDFFALVRSEGQDLSGFAKLGMLYLVFDALTAPAAKRTSDNGQPADGWLQKGVDYLDMHYAEGITVQQAASYVGVDRAHFSRKFRSVYGLSPIRYLQQLKIEAAKRMLTETPFTLAEIALSVGYADLFSFSKAFKKLTGLPPNLYRSSAEQEAAGPAAGTRK